MLFSSAGICEAQLHCTLSSFTTLHMVAPIVSCLANSSDAFARISRFVGGEDGHDLAKTRLLQTCGLLYYRYANTARLIWAHVRETRLLHARDVRQQQ